MSSLRHTINLGNSIIGVSILAMPYCFKKCGIVLSIALIIGSGLLNRAGCHLLLKSALIARRRNYELLAFHVFGPTGKLIVELSVLGFLLGTCIAYFVVIGDLGPALVAHIFGLNNGPQLRALVMTLLAMFIVLPLGLLRRVESLTSFSMLSLGLYSFLGVKMFVDASNSLLFAENNVWSRLNYWQSSNVLSNVPILSMALSCQTQLFEIFDSSLLNSDISSIKQMNQIVNRAVFICSAVYISVGFFGYIAFYELPFSGNILTSLPSNFVTTMTQIAFVFTVLISFPLCLFPCRTSLHSFLFRKGIGSLLNEVMSTSSPSIHMNDRHFRLLTIVLIVITIGISVLLPHIELVLAFLGSTIGAIICFIFPAIIFIRLTNKETNERLMAKFVAITGVFILVVCTLTTIHDMYVYDNHVIKSEHSVDSTNKLLHQNIEFNAINKDDKENKYGFSQMQTTNKISSKSTPLPSPDINKAKRQEELLQRLEKQQLEHKKILEQQKEILNEMKKHNELHHEKTSDLLVDNKNKGNANDRQSISISNILNNSVKNNTLNRESQLKENLSNFQNNSLETEFKRNQKLYNKEIVVLNNSLKSKDFVEVKEIRTKDLKLNFDEHNNNPIENVKNEVNNYTYLNELESNHDNFKKQNNESVQHLSQLQSET